MLKSQPVAIRHLLALHRFNRELNSFVKYRYFTKLFVKTKEDYLRPLTMIFFLNFDLKMTPKRQRLPLVVEPQSE